MAPAIKGRVADLPAQVEPMVVDEESQPGFFDAFLYPNRSLPGTGFMVVMTIVILVNITLGSVFYSVGAWPVLGFCGLDIFLVWLAFKLSYRQGRMHERVRMTANELLVSRVMPSGHETRWQLQPFWTRVEIDQRGEHEVRVRVLSRGRTLILGSFLSPKERESFGDALKAALIDIRMVPEAHGV